MRLLRGERPSPIVLSEETKPYQIVLVLQYPLRSVEQYPTKSISTRA